ncbi:hypothetical protein B0H15DRAFT_649529 [Mycena belliarum]|uniref:Uncharacterized protein n=1 Tax=Mycena belliarum TaxID=1033014 RepID=A0AAD6XFG2_9AGAR|nr:hypothetical protein B0H15DRAFT_649529 [Mycena belliae]
MGLMLIESHHKPGVADVSDLSKKEVVRWLHRHYCMRSRACGGQRHRYPGCRRAGAAVPSRRPLPRLVGETGPASGRETSRALVCSASEDGRHGHA